ncbi:MAG: hypothetical protein ACOYXU_12395 [Nitrospirota bacterium]
MSSTTTVTASSASNASPPYDIYFIGVIFVLNVAMDTWLIVKNPDYALPLFGATFPGAGGWLVKIQSPILHGVLGYGFLRRRRWAYWLYMAYAAFGLSSALVNLATIGFGRIRMIFILSLTVITAYIYTRRRVFV